MTEWIVTSSAMILIVIALRGLLKGKISLKLQYGLWALVLVRLLLPFSIVDSAISVSNILKVPAIQQADSAVSDYRENYEAIRQDAAQRGEAMSDEDIRLQVQQELYDRTYSKIQQNMAQSGTPVQNSEVQTEIQVEAQQQVQVISLTAVLTEALPWLWVAGMVLVAAVLGGSNLHFWWKLRQSRKAMDISGVPLKTYLTDYVATPCLFGVIKPDIYLTSEVMTDSQMRRHVLAHEMSHCRQGDHIWSVLRCVCLVLHWYNPLVWVAAVLSKKDAELACDEATIKALGENERTAYGRTLIGMTCVRRDPRSLMLTATTMLGTKKTLKERIALIAKKPKTALYTLIACILVVSMAVGCTFTGAPTEPTEPTNPDDEVWEQLNDAVDAINSAESRHFSFYMLQEQPGDVDLSGYTPGHECWEYGDDFYLENAEPSQLYYDGTFYARRSDDSWLADRYPDDDAYGHDVYLPSRNSYTVTWTQNDEYLDVVLQSKEDDNESLLYRMDTEGKLLWYGEAFQGSITDGDGTQTDTTLYAVCVFHDTAPEDVREKVETAAAEILATMVEGGSEPNTEPTETQNPQELLEQCRVALEELQSRDSFELIQEVSSSDPDVLVAYSDTRYIHSGNDWIHIKAGDDVTQMYLQIDNRQYVKFVTRAIPEEDRVYPNWTETDLSIDPFASHCWLKDLQWDADSTVFHKMESDDTANEIFVYVYHDDDTRDLYTFRFDIETGALLSVTMVLDDDDGYMYTNRVSVADSIPEYHLLTILKYELEVELENTEDLMLIQQFQDLLSYENGYWYWRAMGCVFEDPEELSLYYLFYNGLKTENQNSDPTGLNPYTDSEESFLKDLALNSTWRDESVWVNAHKMPRQYISDVLNDYFGLSLDDVNIPEEWSYFEETDSYYCIRTDSYGVNRQTVTDVQTDGNGLIYVYWTANYIQDTRQEEITFINQPQMVLTLQEKADGGYLILSNLPVE